MIHITLTTLSHTDSVQPACEVSAAWDGNACLLAISTDGESCDVDSTKKASLEYLCVRSNTLPFADSMHNKKNACGQAVTGTLLSSISFYALLAFKDGKWGTRALPYCELGNCHCCITYMFSFDYYQVDQCWVWWCWQSFCTCLTFTFIFLFNYSINA